MRPRLWFFAVIDLFPTLCDLTGVPPVLAGSGATWFLEGERDNALAALDDEGVTVLVARTV